MPEKHINKYKFFGPEKDVYFYFFLEYTSLFLTAWQPLHEADDLLDAPGSHIVSSVLVDVWKQLRVLFPAVGEVAGGRGDERSHEYRLVDAIMEARLRTYKGYYH